LRRSVVLLYFIICNNIITNAQGTSLPGGINPNTIKQLMKQAGPGVANAIQNRLGSPTGSNRLVPPPASLTNGNGSGQGANPAGQQAEDEKADQELEDLKARDTGPKRFGQDLFNFRDHRDQGTEGGISEDYVLQSGDALSLLMTGDMDDQQETEVDGKGEVAVRSIGTVKISGLTLAQATRALQAAVRGKYSKTDLAVKVSRLREVRVFVLGEVYRPGSYVVPSLSSIINVLSMAGGPDALGSYRSIKLLRGGRALHRVDLYSLRSQGEGNFNFTFQNGDTVFVPLAGIQVMLEGAFTRVVGLADPPPPDPFFVPDDWSRQRNRTLAEIQLLRQQLGLSSDANLDQAGQVTSGLQPQGNLTGSLPGTSPSAQTTPSTLPGMANLTTQPGASGLAAAAAAASQTGPQAGGPASPVLSPDQRAMLESQLDQLYQKLAEYRAPSRGDHRVRQADREKPAQETGDQPVPPWIQQWLDQAIAPRLQFELLPFESAADAVRFAGGLVEYAYQDSISLRRRSLGGVTTVTSLKADDTALLAATALQRGDVLSALPSREDMLRAVTVRGWVRASGRFARSEGLRVGDLLRRDHQVLPDTYLGRGEIVRTLKDGRQVYLSFQVAKALEGDPAENLLLEDRDQVEVYRSADFVQERTVTVAGPMTRPGDFPFYPGMRAADLLFRSGSPLRAANEVRGELARFKDGKISTIIPLELSLLLTSERQTPDMLRDDRINPPLQPDDRISVFEKPNFMVHRVVGIFGEVGKPGTYVIDDSRLTLSQLVDRAGGLTADAMPRAGFFIRNPKALDPALADASMWPGSGQHTGQTGVGQLNLGQPNASQPGSSQPMSNLLDYGQPANGQQGSYVAQADPTAMGINEILNRLSETKRQALTGQLLANPLLHGLVANHLNRLVVDFDAALAGSPDADVELEDGDTIVIPHRTDSVYVVGETVSPFGVYKAQAGLTVGKLLDLAGGTTRNADNKNIRLLKSNGRIIDHGVKRKDVEPGDVVLVPQKIRRDTTWQEDLTALTPLALMYGAIKRP